MAAPARLAVALLVVLCLGPSAALRDKTTALGGHASVRAQRSDEPSGALDGLGSASRFRGVFGSMMAMGASSMMGGGAAMALMGGGSKKLAQMYTLPPNFNQYMFKACCRVGSPQVLRFCVRSLSRNCGLVYLLRASQPAGAAARSLACGPPPPSSSCCCLGLRTMSS